MSRKDDGIMVKVDTTTIGQVISTERGLNDLAIIMLRAEESERSRGFDIAADLLHGDFRKIHGILKERGFYDGLLD